MSDTPNVSPPEEEPSNSDDQPEAIEPDPVILEDAKWPGLKYRARDEVRENGALSVVFTADYWLPEFETKPQLIAELKVNYDGIGISGTEPHYVVALAEPIAKRAHTVLMRIASEYIKPGSTR